MRIGHGYDVHRLVEGRKLILGGVDIPYEKGLLGHSDADVLTHALMDAMLGAAGLGDIGQHFPDSDAKYKGISSLKLLEYVVSFVGEKGFVFGNADITLVAQRPKIGPYREQILKNLAQTIGCEQDQLNFKATTEEHMGFTGNGDGMACHTVCLLKKNV